MPKPRAGTFIVLAILAFALLVAAGKAILEFKGKHFTPPQTQPVQNAP